MCTAVNSGRFFGRTLDFHKTPGESVVITPYEFPMRFLYEKKSEKHHAIIGMAHVRAGIPLYYDAMNDMGLCGAGLYFPGNAVYSQVKANRGNIASFEVLPFILSQCADVPSAAQVLRNISITDDNFSPELPSTPLHWMFSDSNASITVEADRNGVQVFDNPFGVLANNPPFSYHLFRIADFMNLTSTPPENRLAPDIQLPPYSGGMGAIGLPGDHSSSSRFIRAFFNKRNALDALDIPTDANGFFRVMDTVCVPRGCVKNEDSTSFFTIYTSCADRCGKIYYYTTHQNRQICGVHMSGASCEGKELKIIPLRTHESVDLIEFT